MLLSHIQKRWSWVSNQPTEYRVVNVGSIVWTPRFRRSSNDWKIDSLASLPLHLRMLKCYSQKVFSVKAFFKDLCLNDPVVVSGGARMENPNPLKGLFLHLDNSSKQNPQNRSFHFKRHLSHKHVCNVPTECRIDEPSGCGL